MYLKNETCLSKAEETEAIGAAQSVLAVIDKHLHFQFLKHCTLMHFELKSGKVVLVHVKDEYWSEWKILDDKRTEQWNSYLDEKDRLEEEAEKRVAEEQGLEHVSIVDLDSHDTCLMPGQLKARTYIKEMGHFKILCDRPMYLRRETSLSDSEEKETLDTAHCVLEVMQKNFYFATLKTIQLVNVWTKRDKLVLVEVKPQYWEEWKVAEDERVRVWNIMMDEKDKIEAAQKDGQEAGHSFEE